MKKLIGIALVVAVIGCEDQTKKSPNSIVGKTTTNVGEYDPKAGANVSDSKIHATDPITAPMSAYGPMLEKISKIKIDPAVNLFHATEGRYPKDMEEFTEQIMKPNKIELPVLPGGKQYKYDVENHQLVVVDGPEAPKP